MDMGPIAVTVAMSVAVTVAMSIAVSAAGTIGIPEAVTGGVTQAIAVARCVVLVGVRHATTVGRLCAQHIRRPRRAS